jgi:pimeloyl-ACP methyl ester carboxylesterase
VARAYRWPLRHAAGNAAPLALARMVPSSASHPSFEPLGRCQAALQAFRGPLALVWGQRDPILGRVGSFVSRLRPDARATFTEAGHFLPEEVPGEIAAAVRWVAGRT